MANIRDLVAALRQRDGVDAAVVLGRDGLVIDSQAADGMTADDIAVISKLYPSRSHTGAAKMPDSSRVSISTKSVSPPGIRNNRNCQRTTAALRQRRQYVFPPRDDRRPKGLNALGLLAIGPGIRQDRRRQHPTDRVGHRAQGHGFLAQHQRKRARLRLAGG